MHLRYLIRISALGKFPEIDISEAEYRAFAQAREILINALAIEEKYEIVLSNYLDFEKEVLELTCKDMVRGPQSYSDFFDVRLGLNIRLVNLLTAARLYLDQILSNVRACSGGDHAIPEEVKACMSSHYDSNKNYRFMEALRNFVQHRGLPVHWTQLGRRRTDDGLLEFNTHLASERKTLAEDESFKKQVLEELDERTDLRLSARSYVEALSAIQDCARSKVSTTVDSARTRITGAHDRYAAVFEGKLIGLSACAWSDDRQVESIPLLLDWDDVRLALQTRNRSLINLSKRYVASILKPME